MNIFSLLALAAALFCWAFLVEPNWPRLRKIKVTAKKKLKESFTILHLSDIHFTGTIGLKHYFFQRLSMLNPDLIVITGDVIDNDEGIDSAARYLSGLRARYGTFLVLGNHDYYDYQLVDNIRYYFGLKKISLHRNHCDRLVEAMKRIGIRVLVNESVEVNIRGSRVFIGGTDDPVTGHADYEAALRGMKADTFNLLLTHQLDGVLRFQRRDADLILSGHTHGGQIRIPFVGPVVCDTRLPRRYVDGMRLYEGMPVFVSRGLGSGRHLRPRFACRPEAVWIEVASESA